MSLFRVLLIDNDVGLMTPYAEALRQAGCEVDLASTLTSAEDFLAARQYDSVVLDVMIPTRSDFEEAVYRPVSTRGGMESGLEFYKRFRSNLEVTKTAVLVMTVRLDDNISRNSSLLDWTPRGSPLRFSSAT